eukprot:11561167-Alexandrium_andersonii.AAC.1
MCNAVQRSARVRCRRFCCWWSPKLGAPFRGFKLLCDGSFAQNATLVGSRPREGSERPLEGCWPPSGASRP